LRNAILANVRKVSKPEYIGLQGYTAYTGLIQDGIDEVCKHRPFFDDAKIETVPLLIKAQKFQELAT
jgi:hypothetical protein